MARREVSQGRERCLKGVRGVSTYIYLLIFEKNIQYPPPLSQFYENGEPDVPPQKCWRLILSKQR
jgi:hypothetical protein